MDNLQNRFDMDSRPAKPKILSSQRTSVDSCDFCFFPARRVYLMLQNPVNEFSGSPLSRPLLLSLGCCESHVGNFKHPDAQAEPQTHRIGSL